MDHAANLLRAMAPLEQVLRAKSTQGAVKGAHQSSEDGVSSQLPASLETDFTQHGTDPQWVADQLRKMEGQ